MLVASGLAGHPGHARLARRHLRTCVTPLIISGISVPATGPVLHLRASLRAVTHAPFIWV